MPKVTIPKTELKEYGLPYEGYDGVEVISDEITDNSRWSIHHELIFRWIDGMTYKTWYSVGATEMQDEYPWEYEKDVECVQVAEVTVLTKQWSPVDRASKTSRIDYDALVSAVREFVAKVERGEARSVRSYTAFKEALGEAV